MTTPATSCLLHVPMNSKDRKLWSFHFFHVKHLWNFLLLTYWIVYVHILCRKDEQRYRLWPKNSDDTSEDPTFPDYKTDVVLLVEAILTVQNLDSNCHGKLEVFLFKYCHAKQSSEQSNPYMQRSRFLQASAFSNSSPCTTLKFGLFALNRRYHYPGQACQRIRQPDWKLGSIKPAEIPF